MKRPISWSMRFALLISAVFAFSAIVAGGVAWSLQSQDLSKRLQSDVLTVAQGLASIANDADRQDLIEQVDAEAAASQNGAKLVAFVDGATGESYGNMIVARPFAGTRRLVPGVDMTLTQPLSDQAPEAYVGVGIQTKVGWVIVARDEAWVSDGRELLLTSTAWGLGLALSLAIAFAIFIARRNEARIMRMEQVLDAVGAGDTSLRINETADDDLARLAAKVDVTLDRLEAGIESIRQVSTDVAHDLRKPLTRLRIRLEPLALDQTNPSSLRGEVGAALADLDSISATFDAILRLSRLQSGTVKPERAAFDLSQLASEIFEDFAPVAEDAGHHLRFERAENGLPLMGDRELIAQAIINLFENAIRHCPPPAHIVMSVGAERGRPFVSLTDDGRGIAAEDRARVTHRFVRLDNARSSPGTGLGLSLVRAIADLHGAALDLSDAKPGLIAKLIFTADDESATHG